MNRRTLLRFGALAFTAPRSVVVPPQAVPPLCTRCLTILSEMGTCCLCDGDCGAEVCSVCDAEVTRLIALGGETMATWKWAWK